MATHLEGYTREEQRVVVRLLESEGEKSAKTKEAVWGSMCMWLHLVHRWHRNFKSEMSSLADADGSI